MSAFQACHHIGWHVCFPSLPPYRLACLLAKPATIWVGMSAFQTCNRMDWMSAFQVCHHISCHVCFPSLPPYRLACLLAKPATVWVGMSAFQACHRMGWHVCLPSLHRMGWHVCFSILLPMLVCEFKSYWGPDYLSLNMWHFLEHVVGGFLWIFQFLPFLLPEMVSVNKEPTIRCNFNSARS